VQSRIREADEVIRVEVEEGASDWQHATGAGQGRRGRLTKRPDTVKRANRQQMLDEDVRNEVWQNCLEAVQ